MLFHTYLQSKENPMKTLFISLIINCSLFLAGLSQNTNDKPVGVACDKCKQMYEGMPERLTNTFTIADEAEPGEPMIISGTIYKPDGKTPALGVILYVYHTDSKGIYSRGPNQRVALRHGHLRGWIKTGADGKYLFKTIRPAPYPQAQNPAHIHPLIKEQGLTLYWIDEYLFEDDAFVTAKVRSQQEGRGGPGITRLTRDARGVWVGKRDIILGKNIPNY